MLIYQKKTRQKNNIKYLNTFSTLSAENYSETAIIKNLQWNKV